MEVKSEINYDYLDSISRIDDYLNNHNDYQECGDIPARNSLTYSNGFYVDCYALFVDIRSSSKLPKQYQKRVLARIYRSYISELTAIMQDFSNCKEINIVGDCVSGIFSRNGKDDVMQPFQAAYTINGVVKILNHKLEKKGLSPIKIGIGLAKGKALMIQAGFKGSGLNDVVWMGDVVNQASNLCNSANKKGNDVIVVSNDVYDELYGKLGANNIPYQKMLKKTHYFDDYYTGDITLVSILEWLNSNSNK